MNKEKMPTKGVEKIYHEEKHHVEKDVKTLTSFKDVNGSKISSNKIIMGQYYAHVENGKVVLNEEKENAICVLNPVIGVSNIDKTKTVAEMIDDLRIQKFISIPPRIKKALNLENNSDICLAADYTDNTMFIYQVEHEDVSRFYDNSANNSKNKAKSCLLSCLRLSNGYTTNYMKFRTPELMIFEDKALVVVTVLLNGQIKIEPCVQKEEKYELKKGELVKYATVVYRTKNTMRVMLSSKARHHFRIQESAEFENVWQIENSLYLEMPTVVDELTGEEIHRTKAELLIREDM